MKSGEMQTRFSGIRELFTVLKLLENTLECFLIKVRILCFF